MESDVNILKSARSVWFSFLLSVSFVLFTHRCWSGVLCNCCTVKAHCGFWAFSLCCSSVGKRRGWRGRRCEHWWHMIHFWWFSSRCYPCMIYQSETGCVFCMLPHVLLPETELLYKLLKADTWHRSFLSPCFMYLIVTLRCYVIVRTVWQWYPV